MKKKLLSLLLAAALAVSASGQVFAQDSSPLTPSTTETSLPVETTETEEEPFEENKNLVEEEETEESFEENEEEFDEDKEEFDEDKEEIEGNEENSKDDLDDIIGNIVLEDFSMEIDEGFSFDEEGAFMAIPLAELGTVIANINKASVIMIDDNYVYCYDKFQIYPSMGSGTEYTEGADFAGQPDMGGNNHSEKTNALKAILTVGYPIDAKGYSRMLKSELDLADPMIAPEIEGAFDHGYAVAYLAALQQATGLDTKNLAELEAAATPEEILEAEQAGNRGGDKDRHELIAILEGSAQLSTLAYSLTQQAVWITLGQAPYEEMAKNNSASSNAYLNKLLDAGNAADTPAFSDIVFTPDQAVFTYDETYGDWRTPLFVTSNAYATFSMDLPEGMYMVSEIGSALTPADLEVGARFLLISETSPVDGSALGISYTHYVPEEVLFYAPAEEGYGGKDYQNLIGYSVKTQRGSLSVSVENTTPEEEPEEDPEDRPPAPSIPSDPTPPGEEDEITTIPEEEVPLAELPEIIIPEEEVPLAELPEVTILEEEVPLSDIPQTSDNSHISLSLLAMAVSALLALWLAKNKKRTSK